MYAEEERMLKKNVSWRRTCRVVEVENNEEEIEGENNEEEIEGKNSEEVGEAEYREKWKVVKEKLKIVKKWKMKEKMDIEK